MKKMMVVGCLVAIMPLCINAMKINYGHFFELCKKGNVEAIKQFIQQNPSLDINYQTKDYGTTALLHAATWHKWDVVWYLLQSGADKMIRDNYDESLLLKSLSVEYVKEFKKILFLYSYEEINALCKSVPFNRDDSNSIVRIGYHAKSVLDGKKELESKWGGYTALHLSCIFYRVPVIVELLNRGANLESKHGKGTGPFTPYFFLNLSDTKLYLFAVREALNDGPCMPVALLSAVLDDRVGAVCARQIKQFYVEEVCKKIDFFETAQARIWKYVCADACKVAKIERLDKITNQPDEKRGLAALLLLPQKTLTEVNIQLALEGK